MITPHEFNAHVQAAARSFAAADYSGACEAYRQAAEIASLSAHDYLNWGQALANREDYEGAITQYQKAVEINTKSLSVNSLTFSK